MRILFLNWRDTKNPQSGGAEILTHEIAKRLVADGHSVMQFSSEFPNCKKSEVVDGVKVIRCGDPDMRSFLSSVHFKAYKWYKQKKFGKLDIVVDEIHGVPFFTPLYVKEKKVALICEYAGDLWDKATKFPFNYMGRFVERKYPRLYGKANIITISESSKKELQEKLFKDKKISIIHPGCSTPITTKLKKIETDLELVFIARLSKTKGVEDAILATKLLKVNYPNVILHVIGRGPKQYVGDVKKVIQENGLTQNIVLHGYISDDEKISILDKSSFMVVPSRKEGWGLTVHEANSRGVPAIAYNVLGLKDVVVNGVNGYICKKNTPEEISRLIHECFSDKKAYKALSHVSINERKKYSWEKTTEEFIKCAQQ